MKRTYNTYKKSGVNMANVNKLANYLSEYQEKLLQMGANVRCYDLENDEETFIPLSGVSLAIQGISEVFRCIICIQTGHWPARSVVAAEETEKMLMRTSQDEDQKDVI